MSERDNYRRLWGSHPPTNYFARLQPSQRQIAAARAAGVDSGDRAAFDAWLAEQRKERPK